MKKTLLGSYLLCGMLFLSSCKKDLIANQENEINATNNFAVSVSSKGYLNFNTTKDIVEFSKLLFNPKTKNKIIEDIESKGFKAKNISSLSRSTDPNNPYNLIFNADGLLEVNNIILKITDDDKFIYSLKEQYNDEASFNNLVNEIYDGLKMNKINVDRDSLFQFNFIDFTNQNPFGYEESLNTMNKNRPMFGTRETGSSAYITTENGIQCAHVIHNYTTYAFWIAVGNSSWDETVGCVSVGDPTPHSPYPIP